MTDAAIAELVPVTGRRAACAAVGAAQASWYRRHRQSPPPPKPEPIAHRDRRQPRALAPVERQAVVDVLHSERFADAAGDLGNSPGPIAEIPQLVERSASRVGEVSGWGAW
jgi:putative transposase